MAGSFGPEQTLAWTFFYVDEERLGLAKPLDEFARMVLLHGCPDVGNPLANDDESYFLLHPGGFIAGEFDRCLRLAQTDLDVERGEQALSRLGLLSHLGCPMLSAKSYWAEEDLRYAMALACVEGRWDLAGARPSRVIVNAMRNGLLEPAVAPGVLIARRMAEAHWHPPPWSRAFWTKPAQPGLPAQEGPPPPVLPLQSWRAHRASPSSGSDTEREPSAPEA